VDQFAPAEIPRPPVVRRRAMDTLAGAMATCRALNQAHDVRAHGQEMVTVDGERE